MTKLRAAPQVAVLKALADETRLDMCRRLAAEELCVCHFVADMGLSQPLVSHHLSVLKDAGLVRTRRFSYWTYYRLRSESLEDLLGDIGALKTEAEFPAEARPCC